MSFIGEYRIAIRGFFFVDSGYIEKLGVEPMDPIPFARVIETMSRGVFNPVVYRPLFERLGMVTCRTFETPAAGTIPLFVLDPDYVRDVYGGAALELLLDREKPQARILDVMTRPEHYAKVVREIRRDFAKRHSPESRLRDLIKIIET